MEGEDEQLSLFPDSYILRWKLKAKNGDTWQEKHNDITITEYNEIYELNKQEIIWMQLVKMSQA